MIQPKEISDCKYIEFCPFGDYGHSLLCRYTDLIDCYIRNWMKDRMQVILDDEYNHYERLEVMIKIYLEEKE